MWFPCPCTVHLLQWWRRFKSVWRDGAVWGTEAGLPHSRANQRRKRLRAVCSGHPRSEVLKNHFVFANEMFTNKNENLVYLPTSLCRAAAQGLGAVTSHYQGRAMEASAPLTCSNNLNQTAQHEQIKGCIFSLHSWHCTKAAALVFHTPLITPVGNIFINIFKISLC